MKINPIITGATGMVGKAVLLECLESNDVESVLVLTRKPLGIRHTKMKEIIHNDFYNFDGIKEELSNYNACFFCLGVSSLGMNPDEYYKVTYTITEKLSDTLIEANKDSVFIYVSGAGTDSTEKGKINWARVKGKTENMILNKGFKDAYAFRPGIILPENGIKSKTVWVNIFYVMMKPFFPLLKKMSTVTTSSKVAKAMIECVLRPKENKYLENMEINFLYKNI